MRKAILSFLFGVIIGIALISGGIFIDTWEHWAIWACVLGLCLNIVHD